MGLGLQCTQYDSLASLRIFAKIDDVMKMLAEELGFSIPAPTPYVPPSLTTQELSSHIFENLPYNARTGALDQ
jgi:hypothetical protein